MFHQKTDPAKTSDLRHNTNVTEILATKNILDSATRNILDLKTKIRFSKEKYQHWWNIFLEERII